MHLHPHCCLLVLKKLAMEVNTTINKARLFLCKPLVRLKPDIAVQCPTAKVWSSFHWPNIDEAKELDGIGIKLWGFSIWIDPLALVCKAERECDIGLGASFLFFKLPWVGWSGVRWDYKWKFWGRWKGELVDLAYTQEVKIISLFWGKQGMQIFFCIFVFLLGPLFPRGISLGQKFGIENVYMVH